MSEILKHEIKIPSWVLAIFLPIFVTIFILIVNTTDRNASNTAITKISIVEINKRLDRIESKIDNYISNDVKK